MAALQVRPWSGEEFLAGRDTWQAALARSPADPLFTSWDWLACWWRHHERSLGGRLQVLGICSPAGELLGIAPFYLHRATHRGLLGARRLELLGAAWRDDAALFSEYLDVIAAEGSGEAVRLALLGWLRASPDWDELVFCNLRPGSLAEQLARDLADVAYLRPVESVTGWSISLPATFEAFAAQLSSNTRRKTLHQRAKPADLACERIEPGQWDDALERMEQLVARRWGRAMPARVRFNADLVRRLDPGAVRLTELRAGTDRLSVLLSLRAGDTEYYLQSGFDAARAHGLSPGYLHLGFAIEAACRDGLRRFDFLGGSGLHRDYKRDFPAQATTLQSLHLVRKPSLRALFRASDALRGARKIV